MTQQRFGKVIRLFAPLYLSNECINDCKYCGFSRDNPILRVTLTRGGSAARGAGAPGAGLPQYPARLGRASQVRLRGLHGPMRAGPARGGAQPLAGNWADGDRGISPAGRRPARKGWWCIRRPTTAPSMPTCTRPARSGTSSGAWKRRSALTPRASGALASARSTVWATGGCEALSVAAHADYLLRNCWKAQLTISLPRLRPCAGEFQPLTHLSDRELVQLVCAFRLMFPDVGLGPLHAGTAQAAQRADSAGHHADQRRQPHRTGRLHRRGPEQASSHRAWPDRGVGRQRMGRLRPERPATPPASSRSPTSARRRRWRS